MDWKRCFRRLFLSLRHHRPVSRRDARDKQQHGIKHVKFINGGLNIIIYYEDGHEERGRVVNGKQTGKNSYEVYIELDGGVNE